MGLGKGSIPQVCYQMIRFYTQLLDHMEEISSLYYVETTFWVNPSPS